MKAARGGVSTRVKEADELEASAGIMFYMKLTNQG